MSPTVYLCKSLLAIAAGAGPTFVHQSFFEYANQSALHCAWTKLFVQAQIARGKNILPPCVLSPSTPKASGAGWQRIMFVC